MVAERYVDALVSYCESLATFPQRGARRDDIRPGLRLVPYRSSAEVNAAQLPLTQKTRNESSPLRSMAEQ